MTALLLDTTFLVDAERGSASIDEVIDDDDDVAIAAVTVAELLVGVHLASGRTKTRRQTYVDTVLEFVDVLAYDYSVASHHAELLVAVRRAGRPRGAHDLLIAATARASDRVVVTADTSAFEDLPGVELRTH